MLGGGVNPTLCKYCRVYEKAVKELKEAGIR